MNSKDFEVSGVPIKTEWKISFLFGITFVFIWVASLYLYFKLSNTDLVTHIPPGIFFSAIGLGFGVSLVLAKLLGKKMRVKYLFHFAEQNIQVQIADAAPLHFNYDEITLVSLVGTAESMRLFKIESSQQKIKIRLGTYGLAPYSERTDILTMDKMITEAEDILKKYQFIAKKVTAKNVFEYRYTKSAKVEQ